MIKKKEHLKGAVALGFYSVSIIGGLVFYALSKGINGVVLTSGIALISAITAGVGGWKLKDFRK